jgi:hypothetical protein
MQHPHRGVLVGVAGVLLLSALAAAQNNAAQNTAPKSPWKYYPADRAVGDGGPAPKRDLSGTWAGESYGANTPRNRGPESPAPFTALGKQLFDKNRAEGAGVTVANSNDPHVRYCDPYGFPQNMTNEIRGLTVTTLPNRTFILLMYMDLWREIWTDGRTLPAVVGGRARDALDPKYNGYSVGRWEDDFTFVAETTGLVPETWAHESGLPHSIMARVTERFHRSSKHDLSVAQTMTDPQLYSRPFSLGEVHFRWIPNQLFDDFTCIPSEVQRYLKEMADPAGTGDAGAAGAQPRN